MRHTSLKRAAQLRTYRRDRDAYLADHPNCERCGHRAECLHHKRGRQGQLLLDARWWAAACWSCNDFAETNTGQARAEGWLLPMFSDIPEAS
jgi:hypothetical protein